VKVAQSGAWCGVFGEPWGSRSVRKIARNKNRGETCNTTVKTSESIYNEIFSYRTSNMEEKQSQESPRGSHKLGRRALGSRARLPGLSLPCALFRLFIIFQFFYIFQNEQKVLLWNFWSRFTYGTTYLLFFRILEHSERFLLCALPVSLFE
jgi:hypothetical protein